MGLFSGLFGGSSSSSSSSQSTTNTYTDSRQVNSYDNHSNSGNTWINDQSSKTSNTNSGNTSTSTSNSNNTSNWSFTDGRTSSTSDSRSYSDSRVYTDSSQNSTNTTLNQIDSGAVAAGLSLGQLALSSSSGNVGLVLALAEKLVSQQNRALDTNVALARDLAGGASVAYADATSQASGTKNLVMAGMAVVALAAVVMMGK